MLKNLKLYFNGDKMKIDLLRITTSTLVGVQIIMLICLYALLSRVNKIESTHYEDGHEEKYVFKKEEE